MIEVNDTHVTGALVEAQKLVMWLHDGTTQIIEGPSSVDIWQGHRDLKVLSSAAVVGKYEPPATLEEKLSAIQALQGITDTQLNTKVVELRAAE